MPDCLIIGKTNVGKSLFLVNYAAHLGVRELALERRYRDGRIEYLKLTLTEARRKLVDEVPHCTRYLDTINLLIPGGKGKRKIALTDSCGLTDDIHGEEDVRRAMASTLARLRAVEVVLHMLSAPMVGEAPPSQAVSELDRQIARFASLRSHYALLANKMDLDHAKQGLARLQKEFAGHRVIPISALERQGFREVSAFVFHAAR
ncbi:MAG TPA: GTPase domain-containing protein [Firmicutes bacterium]|nr:GTPase domain-containing protein [Bacillota bacterium]